MTVVFEALNTLYGDCLLLRYPGPDGNERLWIVDGGPRSERVGEASIAVWRDVLLPRLRALSPNHPLPVALGMVSHIDDDHINGILRITQGLVAASPANPAELVFKRFWFNSFDAIVGPTPFTAHRASATPAALAGAILPQIGGGDGEAVIQSVGQGISLRADLETLHLGGNQPVNGLISAKEGQASYNIDGAKVTVLGPRQKQLDELRKDWLKALSKPTKEARETALLSLFLPESKLDHAVANLSSIVVWVEVAGKTLLLTGDARGDDIVKAWSELGLPPPPVALDILKLPHHGSSRNNPESFLDHFAATHYVFSANGKYDNPDPPVIEAVVKKHGMRPIVLHFTNADVMWSAPYKLEKSGAAVQSLPAMLSALQAAYPGPWSFRCRPHEAPGVAITLDA
ncbi:hypothetical protein FFK22_026980 [Mycobacterium sp. KBS0706]|uniref:hypothetical protein n=1 Tax=Mycobacterium sp. KBS0706 TaxID=2578109 RepID=UPI00110FA2FF|nr:hypothetical protein [Mycobacterium sp. KBS0706]TSD85503.1 hypothetical protein FFK22_026980 [Mycobacterium sp. KBS0706]